LPRAAQLSIHVDVEEFMQLMQGKAGNVTTLDDAAVEVIAAATHQAWRALSKEESWSMQPHLDKPYAELAEIDKEDNRAAARRMPEVMALVGLGLRGPGEGAEAGLPPEELKALLDQNIDRLAEAEHDGWMEHREKNGWRYAEKRDDARKLHPDMLPYAQLPEREKGKDRNAIRHYPDFAAGARYRIVRLG
jgi:RyR domain-containing protein